MGDVPTLTRDITISEIFGPTIQGEGDLAGLPTVFVRTGGCDYRCEWCDTMYAVDPIHRDTWTQMDAAEVMCRVRELTHDTSIMITLSGGNPALQNGLKDLIMLGHRLGYKFTMETQGSVAKEWFRLLDHLTISPKPPSSKMLTNYSKLDECIAAAGVITRTSLKVVVFDDVDYAYALNMHLRYPDLPFYASVGNSALDPAENPIPSVLERSKWLTEKIAEDKFMRDVRVIPQLHVLLWGNERGV